MSKMLKSKVGLKMNYGIICSHRLEQKKNNIDNTIKVSLFLV